MSGNMRKRKISQTTVERVLLTEVAPFETPALFSNWGSYNFHRKIAKKTTSKLLARLFHDSGTSVPFKFRITKDASARRTLFLLHPNISKKVIDLYNTHSLAILRACSRSPHSLRAPSKVARFYNTSRTPGAFKRGIEEINSDTPYASSYFTYKHFSHLYSFFNSDTYSELEKRYRYMAHLDITKCFPSIYSHTISWAVRGKESAKDYAHRRNRRAPASFDSSFDNLIQACCHRETSGIPIGPEFSRIFAEIILQKVDIETMRRAEADGCTHEANITYYRYIDDYFIFYDDESILTKWKQHLTEELEKYHLYLGSTKDLATERPFITPISILKIDAYRCITELKERLTGADLRFAQREVNHFRTLIKTSNAPIAGVSTFLLSALTKSLRTLDPKAPRFADKIFTLVELAAFTFRMDIRVATCFRWMAFVLQVQSAISALALHERASIMEKTERELAGSLQSALNGPGIVEACNLLLLATECFSTSLIEPKLVERARSSFVGAHNDEYSNKKRLNYFGIVCLLYAVRNRPELTTTRDLLVSSAKEILTEFDPTAYSEAAHLILDLMSCPWISDVEKTRIVLDTSRAHNLSLSSADISEFISDTKCVDWYFSWSGKNHLSNHLKKKELLLSY